MTASDELTNARFFRAMVLMGSRLALACGGESIAAGGADGGTGNAEDGGSANGGSGGTGISGTSAGVGGIIMVTGGASSSGGTGTSGSSGTSQGVGGTIPIAGNTSTGGTAGTGPVVVPNLDCSSDLWSCPEVEQCTNSSNAYTLPENCKCDFGRPASGAECSSGRRVCLMATSDQDGNPFPGPVPFQCTCASEATSCRTSCHVAFPDGDGHDCTDPIDTRVAPADPVGPGGSDILCGCSYVFLK
jgi:hypothetical protein